MRNLALLALLCVQLLSQTVSYTARPKHLALYPRASDDSATVVVAGTLTGTGYDTISASVLRDNTPVSIYKQKLAYNGSSAPFALNPRIRAELSEYTVVLRADTVTLAVFDSLVAGDAYLIDGQSNAVGGSYASVKGPFYRSEFLRSFGNSGPTWTDSTWGIAQCSTYYNKYAVGVWGLEVGKQIVENQRIPVCINNSAMGSTYIASHVSNPSMRNRAQACGIRNSVKAVFWHQGEADGGLGFMQYPASWQTMTDNWRADYPALQGIYLFQVQLAAMNLREVFRNLPHLYPDNHVVALYGTPGFDGVHYADTGYRHFGKLLYPLLARDFYGSTDTIGITAADVKRAFFADEARTRLLLQFDQPLIWPAGNIRTRFQLPGFGGNVDSGSACMVAGLPCIRLALSAACSSSEISYLQEGSYGTEMDPFLKNSRGVAALSFAHFPVTFFNPDPNDGLSLTDVVFIAQPASIEQYGVSGVKAVCTYSGNITDTTAKGCTFMSLDTLVASVSPWGTVRGRRTGTARIRVEKRGFADTVDIVVTATAAALDSLKLSITSRKLLVNDSFSVNATGYFRTFTANVNATASWSVDSPAVVSVRYGLLTGLRAGGPVLVIAELSGKSDTALVTVCDQPAFLKRVNFQSSAFPFKTGWLADNGAVYSSSRGYGWMGAAISMTREDRNGTNFLLKSLVGGTGTWRMDAPAGEYVIKLGVGDNAWGAADTVRYNGAIVVAQTGAKNLIVVDTVVLADTGGLQFAVKGAVDYIVIMSDEGLDINQLADDDGLVPPLYLAAEEVPVETGAPRLDFEPNPFNPSTVIVLRNIPGKAKLCLFDIRGVLIREWPLVRGTARISWNGNDASGLYLARLLYNDRVLTKKAIKLK